jgi:ATP-dependent 26S proteasome regulatory subunit
MFVCVYGLQTVYLPVIGLVPAEELKPTDLVGVNKDNFLILEKLPTEYVGLIATLLAHSVVCDSLYWIPIYLLLVFIFVVCSLCRS